MKKPVDNVNHIFADLPNEIMEAIHQLRHLYRAQQYGGLRGGQMEGRVLNFVARHPGATQSEVVAHVARDKGQVARLIGGLRERGLLEASADEADRRIQRLFLTAQGDEVHAIVQRERRRMARLAVEDLDEVEQRRLFDLLTRLRVNLTRSS